jgi:hypothetical protein
MVASQKQTTIATLISIWASMNLAYILFAIWFSTYAWTTNDIIATAIKVALDSVQLVLAILLVRRFQMWNYRLSIALIPISIAVFWLLPL